MQGILLSIFLWTVIFLEQATESLDRNGTNVCSMQESYAEGYSVSYQNSITKQVSYKCRRANQGGSGGFFFFIYKQCYKNQVVYQTLYKQMYRTAYRTVYTCCSGWQQNGTSCTTAICSQGCTNGKCTKPQLCACYPGYQGPVCKQPCTVNTWGPGCNNTCQCKNNATCDMRNGSCSCAPGWIGDTCQSACQQGFYGDKCLLKCACQNGARCHHVTGTCSCQEGYIGERCDEPCPDGLYGLNCSLSCSCPVNSTCKPEDGTCVCPKGFTGRSCDISCSHGYYGSNCQSHCSCHEDKVCEPVDGNCTCEVEACYEGHKASKDKRTQDTKYPILPIVLSGTAIVIITVVVIIIFVCYRRRHRVIKEPKSESNKITENTGGSDSKHSDNVSDHLDDKPSYIELTHVQQQPHTPLYQGLNTTKSRDKDTSKTKVGHSGHVSDSYQPSCTNTYQPLNRDTGEAYSTSPVPYGNFLVEKSRVDDDDGELYLNILPDHDKSGQSNPIFNENSRIPSDSPVLYGNLPCEKSRVDNEDQEELYLTVLADNEDTGRGNPAFDKNSRISTDSPVLYGNLPGGEGVANEDELYLTVLPDRDVIDEQPYEILPRTT